MNREAFRTVILLRWFNKIHSATLRLTAQSVAGSLIGPQRLLGPMIHGVCVKKWDVETGKGEERRMLERRREFLVTTMPEQLKQNTDAAKEERARGLYKLTP